jgi:hypothetical protein
MVTVKLDKSDYLTAIALNSKWSSKKKLLISGLILAIFLLAWLSWNANETSLAGAILGGAIGGLVGASLVRYVYVPWRARRIFDQQKSLHRAYSVSWDDSGLSLIDETGQSNIRWSDFIKYRGSHELVLLYQSDVMFNMLPKKAFSSDEQFQDFCHFVRTKIHV